ncbi:RNA recognition motif domain containing protein [Entamoeba marina]
MSGILSRYGKRENLSPMSTLFFARLGNTMKGEELKRICQEYGSVEDVTISKGCAFVKFLTTDDAEKCLSDFQYFQNEYQWIVEWAKSTQIRDSDLDKKTLYVTGLIYKNAEETIVYDYFSEYGLIEKVTVVKRDTDFPPYAFIKYCDERSAQNALRSENGKDWDGTQLVVQFSETLESKKSRRIRKTKQPSTYTDMNNTPRHNNKECSFVEKSGSLIQSLISAFSFAWSDFNSDVLPQQDNDVIVRPLIPEIKKVDSPLLRGYEKLIHQLDDDESNSMNDLFEQEQEYSEQQTDITLSFLDDNIWKPYQ